MDLCSQLYTFSSLGILSTIPNSLHQYAFKFAAIVVHPANLSSTVQFSPIHINLGVLVRTGDNNASRVPRNLPLTKRPNYSKIDTNLKTLILQ